jgi:hypothetical protein
VQPYDFLRRLSIPNLCGVTLIVVANHGVRAARAVRVGRIHI